MRLYKVILFVLSPLVAALLLARLVRGRETRNDLAQRLGHGARAGDAARTVWLHGASLGELTSARRFLTYLLALDENLNIVVTSNTTTARTTVTGWNTARLHARLAPLDSPAATGRFLRSWQPLLAFTLENEIWPIRILACADANIPFIVLGGRMSAGSAAMWRKFPGLARQVMGAVTALAPLDGENAARFKALGLAAAKISAPVNLKSTVRLAAPDTAELHALSRIFPRQHTVLAASTHAGEEEIVLAAFASAHGRNPALRLIMAPRHPDRGAQVARLIRRTGLGFSQRSAGQSINRENPVYLADTTGEMPLWYSLSRLSILGASFVPKGGHTPVEPVQFGSVVVHGPDISNHPAPYAALAKERAAFRAQDAASMADIITRLTQCSDTAEITHRATAALGALLPDNPDPETLLSQLDDLSGGKLVAALLD